MGDSLGTCGGPWCVRGPHDGTGDEASLILTPPPPLSLDLHTGFTHFYLFTHSHHIQSFSGLIAPHPQGTLTCEACHQPPAHPSRPPLERQISKTRRYTNVVCCPDMLNAIVSLSCLVNSIQCTAFYGPPPPPPPHLLAADSAQQSMGAILFGDAGGHIREFIAEDHKDYLNVVK